MKDLKRAGVQTRDIRQLVQEGVIEKIKPGLYRLLDVPESNGIPIGFVDSCRAVPGGVICLLSALSYWQLTTFVPPEVYLAVPNAFRPPRINYPPIRFYFFRERFFEFGIKTLSTPAGNVRIYDREKTVCDQFRYRKKLGEDVALEGLKRYLESDNVNLGKLTKYAEICQVKTILTPYLKAMIVE